MKHKIFVAIAAIMLCGLGIGLYWFVQTPSGGTVESREKMLCMSRRIM